MQKNALGLCYGSFWIEQSPLRGKLRLRRRFDTTPPSRMVFESKYNWCFSMKIVSTNRKARRDYQIIETLEAGIELKGNEVKSLRTRSCSIDESFARVDRGELFLYNMHIPEFEKSSFFKPEPKRIRKLLLHKKEIKRLIGLTTQRGFTIIPLKVYFNDKGIAKIEIALAKGKHVFDKRKKIKEEIVKRETQRSLKKFYRGR